MFIFDTPRTICNNRLKVYKNINSKQEFIRLLNKAILAMS